MRRWLALTMLALVLYGAGYGWNRFASFDLEGQPCVTMTAAEAAGLQFGSRDNVGRSPVNGLLVRAALGEPQPRCVQILNRAECTLTGATRVRVEAGPSLAYFSVPAASAARLHLRSNKIRCVQHEPASSR